MQKGFKKILVSVLALVLVLGMMTACEGKKKDDEVLAVVGKDTEILKSHNEEMVELFAYLYGQDTSELDEDSMQSMSDSILEFSVENELLKLNYKGKDILPDDVDDQFDEFLKSAYEQEGVEDAFKEKGISEDTLRYYFESQYYTQKFIEDLKKDDPITDTELKAYYDENQDSFYKEAQVRASHILIGDEDLTDEDREKAEKIRAKVAADPDSFADVAKKESKDTSSAEKGGDVDFFTKDGQMVREFSEAAFALEVDQISEVVETQYGFHIIKVTDKKDAGTEAFEDVKEDIQSTLEQELYVAGMADLKEELGVEYKNQTEADETTTDSAVTNEAITDGAIEEE